MKAIGTENQGAPYITPLPDPSLTARRAITRYGDTLHTRRQQGVVYWWLPEEPQDLRATPPSQEETRNGTHAAE